VLYASTKDERKLSIKSCDIKFCILSMLCVFVFLVYCVFFGLVFVVAMAVMIMSVSRSQNRVRSVCVACFVISSSIFCYAPSSLFSLCLFTGCFF